MFVLPQFPARAAAGPAAAGPAARRIRLVLIAAIAVAGVAWGAGASSATASPVALPAGNQLFGISCDWSRADTYLDVLRLDGADGSANSLGSMDSSFRYFCAFASGWDRVAGSCLTYTVARDPDDSRALIRTDLITGRSTLVGGLPFRPKISSVAIDSSGVAWALAGDRLFTIDLSDASLVAGPAISGGPVMGLTLNPIDGELYVRDDRVVYRVDTATGALTAVADVSVASGGALPSIVGMAIDSAGGFWFSEVENIDSEPWEWSYALWGADASVTNFARSGQIAAETGAVGVFSLTALPDSACPGQELPTLPLPEPTPAALAETGASAAAPAVVGCAASLLGGALLVLRARRRAR